MNRFQIAELKGRDLFEKALLGSGITDYEFTDGRYDRVDVFFTADTLAYCGEIKYRKYPSTQSFFQTEGVVLEKNKYDDMMSLHHRSGYTPVYIHIFSDDICAMYDISNVEPRWVEEERMGKTTMGDTTKIKKIVGYLPLDAASNVSKIPL